MTQQMTYTEAMELATKHHKEGRIADAVSICRQIIAVQPNNAEATYLLGMIASQTGQTQQAIQLLTRAISLNPNSADAFCSLGNANLSLAKFEEAADAYRRSLALRPHCSDAFNGLGYSLYAQHHYEEAVAALKVAIQLEPDFAEAHNNLGIALAAADESGPAINAFRDAIEHRRDYSEAHLNLGSALIQTGEFEDADYELRQAIKLKPELSEAHNNLAGALEQQGQFDDAIVSYRRALELGASDPQVHFNLGVTLLRNGEWQEGWKQYESRLQDGSESSRFSRELKLPRWDGSDLNGKRILLHAEQGLGDTIQFARYVPLVEQRGGKVVLRCQNELAKLLEKLKGVESIITPGDAQPEVDVHCPLLSLPMILETDEKTIPAEMPYLLADRSKSRQWKKRLERIDAKFKVGLVWAGRAEYRDDRRRSMPLKTLAPLARMEGAHFFSLQKGEASSQAKSPPPGMKFTDWSDDLHDFTDTAALIDNLDVIITVDTAVAHLAGAMDKPVCVMLPFVPDWRWMTKRDDSPWYPSMHLLRQKTADVWDGVVQRAAELLAEASAGDPVK